MRGGRWSTQDHQRDPAGATTIVEPYYQRLPGRARDDRTDPGAHTHRAEDARSVPRARTLSRCSGSSVWPPMRLCPAAPMSRGRWDKSTGGRLGPAFWRKVGRVVRRSSLVAGKRHSRSRLFSSESCREVCGRGSRRGVQGEAVRREAAHSHTKTAMFSPGFAVAVHHFAVHASSALERLAALPAAPLLGSCATDRL
jgi:hypothetical protein